ncbi:hypothetical protein [Jannaschia aquimarina]|uniref:Uncharacterized protein n=1 Tax=Jannaschia aquimarina TaxID=935700 RepID=A0A0D1EI85_9RHOB|nr:hypothetical protein [Jannaschia aquimarina]KIT15565.1 hypothetical protein jaqu_26620 [Jannaschia aquimarina]SNT27036.1 hypothetical protein SAMN05421775_109117 [Jannaschia aquimarina]
MLQEVRYVDLDIEQAFAVDDEAHRPSVQDVFAVSVGEPPERSTIDPGAAANDGSAPRVATRLGGAPRIAAGAAAIAYVVLGYHAGGAVTDAFEDERLVATAHAAFTGTSGGLLW